MGFRGIVFRVIEIGSQGEDGSRRQTDWLGITILVLPVHIPVGDPQQWQSRAIGKSRGQAELAAKIVRVRDDGVEVDVGLEPGTQNDLVRFSPGGMSIWSVQSV